MPALKGGAYMAVKRCSRRSAALLSWGSTVLQMKVAEMVDGATIALE